MRILNFLKRNKKQTPINYLKKKNKPNTIINKNETVHVNFEDFHNNNQIDNTNFENAYTCENAINILCFILMMIFYYISLIANKLKK
tara:strand:+ start:406 stop:666 length:261 start_codon:yes stop_codon:yes gene_type:complete